MLQIIIKSARDWYADLTDDALRAERDRLTQMRTVGMADGSDVRVVDAELVRRGIAG